MPTFVCSYVARETKEVSRYGVEDAVKKILDGVPSDISTFRATVTPEGSFRISYDRTFKREIISTWQLEALRSFLFTSGMPDHIDIDRVVVKMIEETPIEADDQRAQVTPILPRFAS